MDQLYYTYYIDNISIYLPNIENSTRVRHMLCTEE